MNVVEGDSIVLSDALAQVGQARALSPTEANIVRAWRISIAGRVCAPGQSVTLVAHEVLFTAADSLIDTGGKDAASLWSPLSTTGGNVSIESARLTGQDGGNVSIYAQAVCGTIQVRTKGGRAGRSPYSASSVKGNSGAGGNFDIWLCGTAPATAPLNIIADLKDGSTPGQATPCLKASTLSSAGATRKAIPGRLNGQPLTDGSLIPFRYLSGEEFAAHCSVKQLALIRMQAEECCQLEEGRQRLRWVEEMTHLLLRRTGPLPQDWNVAS